MASKKKVKRLSPQTVYELINNKKTKTVILDSRSEIEWREAHIPWSRSVDLESSIPVERIKYFVKPEDSIILVLDDETDPKTTLSLFEAVGDFTILGYLDGGFEVWRAAGFPVSLSRNRLWARILGYLLSIFIAWFLYNVAPNWMETGPPGESLIFLLNIILLSSMLIYLGHRPKIIAKGKIIEGTALLIVLSILVASIGYGLTSISNGLITDIFNFKPKPYSSDFTYFVGDIIEYEIKQNIGPHYEAAISEVNLTTNHDQWRAQKIGYYGGIKNRYKRVIPRNVTPEDLGKTISKTIKFQIPIIKSLEDTLVEVNLDFSYEAALATGSYTFQNTSGSSSRTLSLHIGKSQQAFKESKTILSENRKILLEQQLSREKAIKAQRYLWAILIFVLLLSGPVQNNYLNYLKSKKIFLTPKGLDRGVLALGVAIIATLIDRFITGEFFWGTGILLIYFPMIYILLVLGRMLGSLVEFRKKENKQITIDEQQVYAERQPWMITGYLIWVTLVIVIFLIINIFNIGKKSDVQIGRGSTKVDTLIASLKYEILRDQATQELIEIGEPAVQPLVAAMKDKYVKNAEEILIEIGKPAVQPLIAALKEHSGNLSAIIALREINDPRAVEPLINALKDKNSHKIDVIMALGELKDPRAIQPLIDVCMQWKFRALEAMEKIIGTETKDIMNQIPLREHLKENGLALNSCEVWQKWWDQNKERYLKGK